MASTRDCLYLLERWTSNNLEHPEAHKVISYALGRMLRATDYTLDAKTVRRLAAPLPILAGESPFEANTLLQTIDAQLVMLERNGPSVDYARLCVSLAETEATWASDGGLSRFEQLSYFVAALEPELRIEALAWMISVVKLNAHSRLDQVNATLRSTLESVFSTSVDELLAGTAEHYEALKRAVRALASADLRLTIQVIAKVNTRERRDALHAQSLAQLSLRELLRVDIAAVGEVLSEIRDKTCHDDSVTDLLTRLDCAEATGLDPKWVGVITRAIGIVRAPWKAVACAHAESICSRQAHPLFKSVLPSFSSAADAALQTVNSDWDRTDLGFTLATILPDADPKRVRMHIANAHEMRKRSLVPDGRMATSYVSAVRLVIRAFVGLLPRQLDIDQSYARLRSIINQLPSEGERVRLWCELALNCFNAEHKDLACTIVNDEVRSILKNILDPGYRSFVLREAAPALYCAHPVSALRDLQQLDDGHRSQAFERVCWFLLTRQPNEEPVPQDYVNTSLRKEDIDDVLECLRYVERDVALSFYVEKLTDCLVDRTVMQEIPKSKRLDIAMRLEDLLKPKLPWLHGIQHNGYSIVIEGCISSLRGSALPVWQTLASKARAIPNLADKVYVLGVLAHHAPSKHDGFRTEIIATAQEFAQRIPAPLDRIERLCFLARQVLKLDPTRAKNCIDQAFKLSLHVKRDLDSQQRALIDIANRVGEDFAKSLLAQLDDDPAVVKHRRLKQRRKLDEVLKILPKSLSAETLADLDPTDTAELCTMMLSGLRDGSVSYLSTDKVSLFIEKVQTLSFREAYPALAWAVQNSVVSHAQTPYGTKHLLDMFDACASACELGLRLMSRSAGYQSGFAETCTTSLSDGTESIEAGERDKALRIITEWLREQKPTSVKICDPYFSPPDLEILKVVLEVAPNCLVQILAGEKKQRDLNLDPPYDSAYREHWKQISRHNPPEVDLVFAGFVKNTECPIHERWILAGGRGLRLGTSFSGLGRSRLTEISVLSASVSAANESKLDQYLTCRVRDNDGERVRYFTCSLG